MLVQPMEFEMGLSGPRDPKAFSSRRAGQVSKKRVEDFVIKSKRTVSVMLALASVLALAGGVIAQARLTIGGSSANYGVHRLTQGFLPDPKIIAVTSGGGIDASTLGYGEGCGGFVTAQPDAILHYTRGSGSATMLRFFVGGGGDTTLVVNDPAGGWHCNDDSASGNLNPVVDIANAPAGQYDVWIGSYVATERLRGQLNITERANLRP
jgi:hypothetical protein